MPLNERNYTLHYSNLLSIVVLICMLAGCDSESNNSIVDLNDAVSESELKSLGSNLDEQQKVYYFGFDLRASPQEDSRQYQPFLRYLEKATDLKFELRFTPKSSSIIEEIGTGKVHFAAVGAVSYIQGHEKYGIDSLVLGLSQEGKAKYQSMIVTNPDSKIKKLTDLRHKRFAFGSIDSTQGHLIPRIVLGDHNIGLEDLGTYKYTGSHRNCAEAVISSKFDACGMQDTMAKDMTKQGLLRILHASHFYPSSGVVANQELPPEVVSRVKQALIDFEPNGKDKEKLYNWHKTEMPNGFVEAKQEYYSEMRHWLIKFGMLELPENVSVEN